MAEKSFMEVLKEETPDVSEAFFNMAKAIESGGGLDPKTFQLVYIAIKASNGETGAVATHTGYAKKAGATREEVRGAILVTMMTSGVSGIRACLIAALEAYDKT